MRLLSFIFAIYVMALANWPCTDDPSEGHAHSHLQVEQAYEDEHNHSHSHDSQDTCSPFCLCQCCQVHMQLPVAFFHEIIPQPDIDKQDAYHASIPELPGVSFFIPPRA